MIDFDSSLGLCRPEDFYKYSLDPERYHQAKQAFEKMKTGLGNFSPQPEILGLLLDEQYETQTALKLLHATSRTQPSEIIGMNQVYPTGTLIAVESHSPLVIEVMGSPATGKTTLIENASKIFTPHLIVHKEVAKKALPTGDANQRVFTIRYNDIYENKKFQLNSLLFEKLNRLKRFTKQPISVLADRWLVDNNIFGLAQFSTGRIYAARELDSTSPLETLESIVNSPFDPASDIQYAIILCLALPETSLKRDSNPGTHTNFLTPEFLPVLYEQYLRFHAQMLLHRRPFIYSTLDLTSDNFKENQKKFNTIVEKIMEFYTRKGITGLSK